MSETRDYAAALNFKNITCKSTKPVYEPLTMLGQCMGIHPVAEKEYKCWVTFKEENQMSPDELEILSRTTWSKLKTDPLENYDLMAKHEAGKVIIKAHSDFVKCLVACNCDVRKATKVFSNNQAVFEDLTDNGKEFRLKLAEMLKVMLRTRNK